MGEVKVVIQCRAAPNTTCLNPAVIRWCDLAIVRRAAPIKQQGNIGLQCGLVTLDGEMIMGATRHQVTGYFTLCQQGICGDIFAFDLDRIQQWDKHPDFVGLFGLVRPYCRQCADFFWV